MVRKKLQTFGGILVNNIPNFEQLQWQGHLAIPRDGLQNPRQNGCAGNLGKDQGASVKIQTTGKEYSGNRESTRPGTPVFWGCQYEQLWYLQSFSACSQPHRPVNTAVETNSLSAIHKSDIEFSRLTSEKVSTSV